MVVIGNIMVVAVTLFAELTHSQLIELREAIKNSGLGKQGHSRTAEENARALLHVHQHRQAGMSYDRAIKHTAAAELASPSTLRSVVQGIQRIRHHHSSRRLRAWQRESVPSTSSSQY